MSSATPDYMTRLIEVAPLLAIFTTLPAALLALGAGELTAALLLFGLAASLLARTLVAHRRAVPLSLDTLLFMAAFLVASLPAADGGAAAAVLLGARVFAIGVVRILDV
jgi:hypothetical protein